MKNLIFALCCMIGLFGCTTTPKSLYYWGSYPNQTYLMYSDTTKASPSAQINTLEKDIQKAQAKNLAIPPGFYAHLGLMYLEEGNYSKAENYFQLEKQVYPESTTLINRLLNEKSLSEPKS
ncbi:DUF4810 domain-containing protein [Acinetobacter populi]|uniref:DUF4810 domain-containing protein n=1 Tax=Acinetobacter populi TaxID=1582270 RepID=A0A1Z9YY69_9GAMM|nr:DUF4810 domain-containing protein [Acinetobacter populi]OUY07158.1 DUF4810 domain-containing protein [Acinetobacter populi]